MRLVEILKKNGFQIFSSSDGACACGEMYIGGILIAIHCHRTVIHDCDCKYAGVHYVFQEDTSQAEAKAVAEQIASEVRDIYFCDCKVVYDEKLKDKLCIL